MNAWTQFFILLGKITFSVLVCIGVAIVLGFLAAWMHASDEPEQEIQPKVYPMYDSKGRLIERKLVERRNGK